MREVQIPFHIRLCAHFLLPPLNTSNRKGVQEPTLTTSHEVSSNPHFAAGIVSHRESDLSKDRQRRLTVEPGTMANALEVHCSTHRLPLRGANTCPSCWKQPTDILLSTFPNCPFLLTPQSQFHLCPLPFLWQPFHVSCLIWLGPRPGSLRDS